MPAVEEFDSFQGINTVAYAATVTPDATQGEVVVITLTGPITLNNPANPAMGQRLTLELIQDATGTRVATFGAAYKTNWTPTTTAGLRNVIGFFYDGAAWVQLFSAVGLPA